MADIPFLDEQANAVFNEWAETKWQNKKCPACGANTWEIQDNCGFVLVLERSVMLNKGFPFLVAICADCGYTHLFSTKKIGIEMPGDAGQEDADSIGGNEE